MTLKDLSQVYWLNREIERERARLEELRAKAEGGAHNVTGMPRGFAASDRASDYAAKIADLREIIEINIKRCFYELRKLNRFINGVEDAHMRAILTLRFVNGLSWEQVAASVGGGNTAAGTRMACKRFLKKYCKK